MKKHIQWILLSVGGFIATVVTVFNDNTIIVKIGKISLFICMIWAIGLSICCLYKWGKNMYKKISNIDKLGELIEKLQQLSEQLEYKLQLPGNNLVQGDKNVFCPITSSSYVDDSSIVGNELCKIIDNEKNIKELHIICFGRNGFGGVIEHIINKKINIVVKVVVFNAEAHPDICQADDKKHIERNIVEWLKDSDNIEVIVSEIPPMVRAAVVYAGNGIEEPYAIWGSIQSYRFAYNAVQKRISLEKPRHSMVSVCRARETVEGDFHILIKCFEEEFSRLEKAGRKAMVMSDSDGNDCVMYK